MKMLLILLSVWSSLLSVLEQKTLQSDFTVTITTDNQPLTYKGQFAMHADCFSLNAFGMEMAFDGQTMYLYQQETNELTLSTPTSEELMQTNPLLFAQVLAASGEMSEQPAADGKTTLLTLVPAETSAGISKISLRVRMRDYAPLMIEVREKERTTTLRLTAPVYSDAVLNYTLTKDGAYLNDLREL